MGLKAAFGTVAVVLGTAVFSFGWVTLASAQQVDNSARAAAAMAPHRGHAAKPAPKAKTDRPWSIEDALPSHSSALDAESPAPASKLGRISWESGTLGVETETKVKPRELPDGQPLPGIDPNAYKPPSYLGLSLSLPTSDKSSPIAPATTLLPPLGRTE